MEQWSDAELTAAVDAYRWMQCQIREDKPLNKTQVYRTLAATYGRSPGSWEYRMQNISHVLNQANLPWIAGLKPASHAGSSIEMRLREIIASPISGANPGYWATPDTLIRKQELELSADIPDDRDCVLATIARRRGQPAFRLALLELYGGRCAMTGCDVTEALEAAHIYPYRRKHSYSVDNGIILRADVHTLFDLHLISIDPVTVTIDISPSLKRSTYGALQGALMRNQSRKRHDFSIESIEWHRSQCDW